LRGAASLAAATALLSGLERGRFRDACRHPESETGVRARYACPVLTILIIATVCAISEGTADFAGLFTLSVSDSAEMSGVLATSGVGVLKTPMLLDSSTVTARRKADFILVTCLGGDGASFVWFLHRLAMHLWHEGRKYLKYVFYCALTLLVKCSANQRETHSCQTLKQHGHIYHPGETTCTPVGCR